MRWTPWLVLSSLLGPLRAQDVAAPEGFSEVRAGVATAIQEGRTPALSLAVVRDGEIVWAEGFGLANRETRAAATADTIYRIASISKPITATALMLLVERGKIDLDAPANRYLAKPGVRAMRGRADDITLRRLANHTAGLPTHWSFFYKGIEPPTRDTTIARYGFAAWPPGIRTNYSNLAFGILDHIVARVGGVGYREFLVRELLDPAGMSSTDVGVRPDRTEHAAVAYRRAAAGRFVPVVDYGFDHDGASAVRSSARDLARFAQLHMSDGDLGGERLLRAETVRAMRKPRARDAGSRYGVSWGITRERGALCQSHTGGMPGVATILKVFPERRAAVAALTNSSNRNVVYRTADAILDVLLGAGAGGAKAAPPAPKEPAKAAEPGAWRGHIDHFDGPVPIVLETRGERAPHLRVGGADVRSFTSHHVTSSKVRLRFRGPLLRTTGSFHGTPDLDLDLRRNGEGWSGVLHAVGDSTFRLPHWVELHPRRSKAPDTLRVVSYNVLVGFGNYAIDKPYLPGRQRRSAVTTWLGAQQADVVALQEMNGYTTERLRNEAAAWGHGHAVMLKEKGYPTALTSRWPIEVVERRFEGLHHGLMRCRTGGIDFVVAHLVPHAGIERKVREADAVVDMYRAARREGRATILIGDFNAVSAEDVDLFDAVALDRYRKWKWTFTDGKPVTAAIQRILDAGAVDAWTVHRPAGTTMSLPRVDFVFASPDLASKSRACAWLCVPDLLKRSDHPPVVADFAWSPKDRGGR